MITLFILISFVKSVVITKKPIIATLILVSLVSSVSFGILIPQTAEAISLTVPMSVVSSFSIVKNGKLTICKLNEESYETVKKIKMTVTAYTSTPDQTDDSPFITASNKHVADGIIANNMLPFGTKVRIPELYGDKVFVVEDRMNQRKGNFHADIWMAEYDHAINFGAKVAYIEVLEN